MNGLGVSPKELTDSSVPRVSIGNGSVERESFFSCYCSRCGRGMMPLQQLVNGVPFSWFVTTTQRWFQPFSGTNGQT